MYVIWNILPTYDNRDAIVGSRALRASPMAYVTRALAGKIASRFADYDAEVGGDGYFVVAPVDVSPFDHDRAPAFSLQPVRSDDEIPF
jgi:hypothetical protein